MVVIVANYREILSRMNEAAAQCGRNPNDIKLLGASKSQSFEAIRAAIRRAEARSR